MGLLISVLIPVYQEGEFIGRILEDVCRQDLDLGDGREARLEVLVVDGGSTDETRAVALAVAGRDSRVRLLENPGRRVGPARAIGVDSSVGDYVAIIDGHCRIQSSTLLRDMVMLFERTGADCLARPQPLVSRDPRFWTEAICAARASRFGHNLRSTIWDFSERRVDPRSSGAMYRRSVFERVGNFDGALDAGVDIEFNGRVRSAGLSCWTSPRLAIEYEPRRSLRALWRQMFRYGVGWANVQRKCSGTLTLGPVLAAAFVAGLALVGASPILPRPLALAVLAPYALYLVLSVASSCASARRAPTLVAAMPVVFFVLHAGLGSGFLWGMVRHRP